MSQPRWPARVHLSVFFAESLRDARDPKQGPCRSTHPVLVAIPLAPSYITTTIPTLARTPTRTPTPIASRPSTSHSES